MDEPTVMWEVVKVLSRRPMHDGRAWKRYVLVQWWEPPSGFEADSFVHEVRTDLDDKPEMENCSWRPLAALSPSWSVLEYQNLPCWPEHLPIA